MLGYSTLINIFCDRSLKRGQVKLTILGKYEKSLGVLKVLVTEGHFSEPDIGFCCGTLTPLAEITRRPAVHHSSTTSLFMWGGHILLILIGIIILILIILPRSK